MDALNKWLNEEKVSIIDIGARAIPGEKPVYENLITSEICKITTVDPDTTTNAILNRVPNTTVTNVTLGTGVESLLHICTLPSCSSLLKPNMHTLSQYSGMEHFYNVTGSERVDAMKMDTVFPLGNFDFLSIDVQGAELEVLRHGKRNLANLLGIHIEVSFVEKYLGQPLFRDVDSFLANNKFSFHCFTGYGTRSPKEIETNDSPINGINQWLWADAFYFHDLTDTAFWREPGRLLKLAAIFHYIYNSYDFAAHCLNSHDKLFGSTYFSEYI
ncbi:FkbM family methyltransferase, partial [Pseudomonas kairouanensis]